VLIEEGLELDTDGFMEDGFCERGGEGRHG
jgi:hypothetical protein